jgi:hypothetical protein
MWVIKPKKSVGSLCLGDKMRDVKEKLGTEYDTFKRVPNAEDTIFAFDQYGVHLTCGYDEKVKIISVFRPNKVEYENIQLLDRRIENVKEELIAIGIAVIEEESGLWVEEAGILLIDIDGTVDGIELYSE